LTSDWLQAHSLAGAGGGYAWPALEFWSDREWVHLQLSAENRPDVCGIRYLRSATIAVTVQEFERATASFLDQVEQRLLTCGALTNEISDLRSELHAELSDPTVARRCRLQALAGIDPGDAGEAWVDAAISLTDRAGGETGEELVAAFGFDLEAAGQALDLLRSSGTTIDISQFGTLHVQARGNDQRVQPWEHGAYAALQTRKALGILSGPVSNDRLSELLQTKLPLAARHPGSRSLLGGFRLQPNDRVATLVRDHPTSQRFDLSRLIGSALLSEPDQSLFPVTDSATALQKYQRAFAQEFLCPWSELKAFTQEHGTDEEAIDAAADYYGVSQYLVLTALVNRNQLPRHRLPTAA
jgi:hypothetical protein